MNPTDIPSIDTETAVTMKKIQIEAKNNRAFFEERRYLDTEEMVGDNPFWSLKIVEEDSPVGREEGYTYYFAIKNLEDTPTEKMMTEGIESIHLDKAEPDETGEARFVVTEQHDFDSLDELFSFCHDDG